MRLLHFRRTFVEKMFAIHGRVEAPKREGKALGGHARHYYDLYCLAARPEVVAMLGSEEYGTIRADYDRISREHFDRSYVPPPGMSFATRRSWRGWPGPPAPGGPAPWRRSSA